MCTTTTTIYAFRIQGGTRQITQEGHMQTPDRLLHPAELLQRAAFACLVLLSEAFLTSELQIQTVRNLVPTRIISELQHGLWISHSSLTHRAHLTKFASRVHVFIYKPKSDFRDCSYNAASVFTVVFPPSLTTAFPLESYHVSSCFCWGMLSWYLPRVQLCR